MSRKSGSSVSELEGLNHEQNKWFLSKGVRTEELELKLTI